MIIEVRNSCEDYTSYRAQRTKSLFNVDSGADFHRDFHLPVDELMGWTIGVVVGPSGSGKSSIGRALCEPAAGGRVDTRRAGAKRAGGGGAKRADGGELWEMWDGSHEWPAGIPIIDAIGATGRAGGLAGTEEAAGSGAGYDAATAALASVGLGDVPSWLRPHSVLSNGERFRADLARVLSEGHDRVVIDEFTSVVDRQVAQIGAGAFQKAWRRGNSGERQAILLTCHYDVLEWVDPDWVLYTETGELATDTRGQFQRPRIELEVVETGWSYWDLFKPHHYLVDAGPMPFGTAFVGFVNGDPVAHLGMSTKWVGSGASGRVEARACRMVVMPEWQGAGIGLRFLNALCERELEGVGVAKRKTTTLFHTNHPALVAALRRDGHWRQISQVLHGGATKPRNGMRWGGHLRGVQGFRYYGEAGVRAAAAAKERKEPQ